MKKKGLRAILFVWLVTETVLFLTVSVIRILGDFPAILCQLTTFFTFLAAVFGAVFLKRKELIFLSAAMALTVVSDVFLVWIDGEYEIAVSIFFAAQVLHFIRLIAAGCKWKQSLALRIGLTVAILVVLWLTKMLSFLTAAGAFYAAELLMNTADSARMIRIDRRFLLCLIGFVLFCLCDVTVGLRGIGRDLTIPPRTLELIGRATWIFYIPSQVLIVLSGVWPAFRRNS